MRGCEKCGCGIAVAVCDAVVLIAASKYKNVQIGRHVGDSGSDDVAVVKDEFVDRFATGFIPTDARVSLDAIWQADVRALNDVATVDVNGGSAIEQTARSLDRLGLVLLRGRGADSQRDDHDSNQCVTRCSSCAAVLQRPVVITVEVFTDGMQNGASQEMSRAQSCEVASGA